MPSMFIRNSFLFLVRIFYAKYLDCFTKSYCYLSLTKSLSQTNISLVYEQCLYFTFNNTYKEKVEENEWVNEIINNNFVYECLDEWIDVNENLLWDYNLFREELQIFNICHAICMQFSSKALMLAFISKKDNLKYLKGTLEQILLVEF